MWATEFAQLRPIDCSRAHKTKRWQVQFVVAAVGGAAAAAAVIAVAGIVIWENNHFGKYSSCTASDYHRQRQRQGMWPSTHIPLELGKSASNQLARSPPPFHAGKNANCWVKGKKIERLKCWATHHLPGNRHRQRQSKQGPPRAGVPKGGNKVLVCVRAAVASWEQCQQRLPLFPFFLSAFFFWFLVCGGKTSKMLLAFSIRKFGNFLAVGCAVSAAGKPFKK